MSYQAWHLRIFNVLARLLGLGSCLVGLVGLVSALLELWAGRNPLPEFVIAILVSGIGIAFLRVRPYRPDLKGLQPRGWWTGEPRN